MAGSGPLLRSDFPKLYASRLAYIKMLIGPTDWPEVDQQWERFYNMESSDRMREEWLLWAGFGLFDQMGENDPVTYDQMLQGPSKSVTHTLYGLGYQIGFLAAKHDLDGIIKRNAPELGRSLRMSVQTLAAADWNGAFDTTTTADGLTVFNTAHTFLRGGGTYSNRSSTDASLGHTALETGIVQFRKFKDHMGNPMPMNPEWLMTAPDLEPITHELLQSQMRHDTTTHANSFLTGKLRPESWPFFTITTGWVIGANKSNLKVYWIWNIRPETSHGFDFDREAAKTKTLFASSTAFISPLGLYGSKGA